MNHLVFLNAQASELEKILSGTKSMVVKEFDPARPACQAVRPGDSLYFLRNQDDCTLRVKATVVRALTFTNCMAEDLSHILKEMQSRLQLTEEQYNYWSVQQQCLLVEFGSADKIGLIHVALNKITDRSGWTAFEDFKRITE